jgi:pyrimidine operon attenuation protein / uracil phosphoribosyltransferase
VSGRKQILDPATAEKKLRRMAFEIVERNAAEETIVLAGIRENGFLIATLLKDLLASVFKGAIDVIGIQMDKRNPTTINLDEQQDYKGKCVIIVDDVANSGKTMLFALKPFLDNCPKKIQTLVLVERTHKTFPIHPDYKGLSIATTIEDHIQVEIENGRIAGAWLI